MIYAKSHHIEEFVRQFKWAITSRQIFKWHQSTNPETLTDIQRAARFYYLQQHAFSGKVTGQNFNNDHPDTRSVFSGLTVRGLDIKYCMGSTHGHPQTSKELVVTNWGASSYDSLF